MTPSTRKSHYMLSITNKSNKPRLAYVINVDWYFRLHWLNRAKAALTSGYQVYIITAFVTPGVKREFEIHGFDCIHIRLSRTGINPVQEIKSAIQLYRILKQIQPDIVHSITVKPNIYAGIAANLLRVPSIKSIPGLGVTFSNHGIFYRLIRKLILVLYKPAGAGNHGAFVFENMADKTVFYKNGLGRKQEMIHIPGAGIDASLFRFAPKPFPDRLKILFAARLLKEKGLDTLVSAVEAANTRGCPCDLLVAGIFDPAAKAAYSQREIHALASSGKIQWLGQVNDMPALLDQVDIVALPTRYGEGIPRILIEAGAVGRLVITTAIPGCSQLLKNNINGILVQPNDADGICKVLCNIMKHPHRYEKMSATFYKEILNRYTDKDIIPQFLGLYSRFCR